MINACMAAQSTIWLYVTRPQLMKILCSQRGEPATLDAYLHFQQAPCPLYAGLRRMAEARNHSGEKPEIIIGGT